MDILPISWQANIDEELGSNSVAVKDKVLSDEDCNDLCSLMQSLMSCCARQKVDTTTIALGLWDLFVNEKNMSRKELHETVQTWVTIEEDEFVIAEEVMEALADLNSDVVQVTADGECNMNNAEDRQQAQHERDISPMDLECIPLPTDAEMKEMFDSIKQHLVHEKEDELVR